MITEVQMRQVLDAALAKGGDFAELFFEDRQETNIRSVGQSIQGVKNIQIHGVGLTVLDGVRNVYVYTNHTGYEDLIKLAQKAAILLDSQKGQTKGETLNAAHLDGAAALWKRTSYPNPNPIRIYPQDVDYGPKIRVVQRAEQAALRAEHVLALNVDYFDNDQRILVANSDGLLVPDRRVNTRLRFQITVGDEKDSYYEWEDYTKAQGFEAFSDSGDAMEECEAFAQALAPKVMRMRNALPAKSCRVPVVLAAGNCGTLWHECCGHGLEACAIASGNSIYVGKIGQRVASDKVTLLDDGTFPGLYGSSAIDDEGHPRTRNVLIENGILKQYLCDRLHGRMLGVESNGCGRRQNYTYAATSRMSNTYLAPGIDEEEEIIRSVPEGLYVKSLGGGTGGAMFTLSVKEGYWIKNGQIDRPVKGLTLSGNGLDMMQKVDRVGKHLETEMGGFCGAASGLIPTTAFQPMVRISEMTISGGDA